MRTFHIQVLFQVATESYSIYCATKDDRPVILASLNSSSECTFIRVMLKKTKCKQTRRKSNSS